MTPHALQIGQRAGARAGQRVVVGGGDGLTLLESAARLMFGQHAYLEMLEAMKK